MSMKTKLKHVFSHKHEWEVLPTVWPYPSGWGVCCKKCRMVTDVGLKKEHAESIAKTNPKYSDITHGSF